MPTRLLDDERVYATATLGKAITFMTKKGRDSALKAFDFYVNECQRIEKRVPNPESFAASLHQELDEHVARMVETSPHGKDVKCQRGCAHCCHTYVGIFPHEARLLRAAAEEAGIEVDEARLARQAAKTEKTWLELAPEDRRCVFLGEDRACKVYEHRPGSCRKYLVMTDPDLCDLAKHPGGDVGVVYSLQAEIMYSAAMSCFSHGSDNMAAVLLAVKVEDRD